jgi:hypothetical protein
MGTPAARLKRAELTSGVGALVLGVGLGALFPDYLGGAGLAVLLTGLLLHAWGMYDKHRLERGGAAASVWWADLLYWVCWAALLLLLASVGWRQA